MNVLKFGGTSVAGAECILRIKSIVESSRTAKWTVVSAMSGVTDMLLAAYRQAIEGGAYLSLTDEIRQKHLQAARTLITQPLQEFILLNIKRLADKLVLCLHEAAQQHMFSEKTQDYVLSFGERMNGYFVSNVIDNAQWVDARPLIKTDSHYGNAEVDFAETYRRCRTALRGIEGRAIIPGFIAANERGEATTLGRGGSDYTAAIIAAAVGAESVEIWTDTDGFMTADPRRIPQARTIPQMTYAEVFELARFGAKVVYPPTVYPLLSAKIPMYIKNTFNPACAGTLVCGNAAENAPPICSVSTMECGADGKEMSLIAAVGENLHGNRDILPQIERLLRQNDIEIAAASQEGISILIRVESGCLAKSTQLIHETFIVNGKC